ncbi:MAG: RidA family protein [Halodesulfovibrio sp.]|uniref:RidA family protein n=1 Tax=Halodesulfovibrio sp. TaxID=1912772 RepID=UPI00359D7BFA
MSPTIFSPNYPAPVSNYSQVLGSGDRVVTSRLHMDAKMVEGGTKAEAHQPVENLKAILKTAITNMAHVLKVNIFFTDLRNRPALVGGYNEFFKTPCPCCSDMVASGLPHNAGGRNLSCVACNSSVRIVCTFLTYRT